MKAVIAGAGATGIKIAKYLINIGYKVSFIDHSISTIRELTDSEGIAGIYGDCTSVEDMRKVGIEEADIFIAVTPIDEINVSGCFVAKYFAVKKRVAKFIKPNYLNDIWLNEIIKSPHSSITSVVTPNYSLIDSLLNRFELKVAATTKLINFFEGKLKIFSIFCEKKSFLLNTTILEFNQLFEDLNFKIFAIIREGGFINISDDTLLKKNDSIYIAIDDQNLVQFSTRFNLNEFNNGKNKNLNLADTSDNNSYITIIGDHPSINHLVKRLLEKRKTMVNIILNNNDHAESLAKELYSQNIKSEFFNIIYTGSFEQSIDNLYLRPNERIIIFNNQDRQNVFLSLYAKFKKIDNITCLLQDSRYENFMSYNGIYDTYVADQFVLIPVISEIAGPYESNTFLIGNNNIEIFELNLYKNSNFIGKNLKDINLNGITAIAAISDSKEDNIIYIKDNNLLLQENYIIIFAVGFDYIKEARELFIQPVELDLN